MGGGVVAGIYRKGRDVSRRQGRPTAMMGSFWLVSRARSGWRVVVRRTKGRTTAVAGFEIRMEGELTQLFQ